MREPDLIETTSAPASPARRRPTMSTPSQDTAASPQGGARVGAGRVDPEAALVEKLRREDPDAPEQLVATFGDRVYRLAIRITGNEQDAEEVTQDALWTAARKIHTFKGESAFGSWLYRITANTAYQKLRGRQSKKNEVSWEALFPSFDELGNHVDPGSDWSAKAEEPALQKELREVLSAAIGDLPEDYRTAFLMHDVEGLSNPEIAESLGISLPAVKSRVHRSRLFLRQRLSGYLKAA
jgi:RNA polymerase sigma-70 factor, ECF subfamily